MKTVVKVLSFALFLFICDHDAFGQGLEKSAARLQAPKVKFTIKVNGSRTASIGSDGPLLVQVVAYNRNRKPVSGIDTRGLTPVMIGTNGKVENLKVEPLDIGNGDSLKWRELRMISWQVISIPTPGDYRVDLGLTGEVRDTAAQVGRAFLTILDKPSSRFRREVVERGIKRLSGDTVSVINDLEKRVTAGEPNTVLYSLQLVNDYTSVGRYSDAEQMLLSIASKLPDDENASYRCWISHKLEGLNRLRDERNE